MSSFAEIVASWPAPNYVDPETRGNGIIVASIIFGLLGTTATILRLFTRGYITRTFGLDDALIVIAWLTAIAMFAVMSMASAHWGWDRHVWDIPIPTLTLMLQSTFAFEILFAVSSCFTKLSLLWFCRRIVGDGRKIGINYHALACVVVMVIVGAFLLAYTIVEFIQCRPLKAYWDVSPTYPYTCIDYKSFILGCSIGNTVTDFLTTLIPVSLIARLRLQARHRIAVMSIFGLGLFVNIAGAVRVFYVHRTMQISNLDSTWVGWPTDISSIIEIGIGLIVASAPALRPLINHFIPSFLESNTRKLRWRRRDRSLSQNQPVPLSSGNSRPRHFRKGSAASELLHHDYYNLDGLINSPDAAFTKDQQSVVEITAVDRDRDPSVHTYPFTNKPLPTLSRSKSQSNRLEVNVTRSVILDVNDTIPFHSQPPGLGDGHLDTETNEADLDHGYGRQYDDTAGMINSRNPNTHNHSHSQSGSRSATAAATTIATTITKNTNQSPYHNHTPSNTSSQERVSFGLTGKSSTNHSRTETNNTTNNGSNASVNVMAGRAVSDPHKTSWLQR